MSLLDVTVMRGGALPRGELKFSATLKVVGLLVVVALVFGIISLKRTLPLQISPFHPHYTPGLKVQQSLSPTET